MKIQIVFRDGFGRERKLRDRVFQFVFIKEKYCGAASGHGQNKHGIGLQKVAEFGDKAVRRRHFVSGRSQPVYYILGSVMLQEL